MLRRSSVSINSTVSLVSPRSQAVPWTWYLQVYSWLQPVSSSLQLWKFKWVISLRKYDVTSLGICKQSLSCVSIFGFSPRSVRVQVSSVAYGCNVSVYMYFDLYTINILGMKKKPYNSFFFISKLIFKLHFLLIPPETKGHNL